MPASIHHQIDRALGAITWDPEKIKAYQKKTGTLSVKKALRPDGDPTCPLPVILGVGTRKSYYDAAGLFFSRAKTLTGHNLLSKLLDPDILTQTFDEFYFAFAPGTLKKTLAAIYKVYLGCKALGWTRMENPVTPTLRSHVKAFRDDFGVRSPRYGYQDKDAERIVQYLVERHSHFALAAELALRCGLRKDELAGLKGKDIDKEKLIIKVIGKGGRYREVPLPAELAGKLNTSRQFIFTPSRSWKSAFFQAVVLAAKVLEIDLTGVHRLRSNFAQNLYEDLREDGLSEDQSRDAVSQQLGHNRCEVTHSYVP
jgi:integrase